MKAYSQDLRDRVLAACKAGDQSQAAIAEWFDLSVSTVEKWWHQKRTTGKATPRTQTHGPQRTLHTCAPFIRAELRKHPDLTLAELCARVAEVEHVHASPSMMCRELQHLQLPRKKSRSTPASGTPPASAGSAAHLSSARPTNGRPSSHT
ncbi:MAG: hypothetical protein WCF84_17160 [Anaerolineae bacterium]